MSSIIERKLNLIQAKARIAAIKSLKKDGKALLHMATGTGKTRTAIGIIKTYIREKKRILWVTHKIDLVQQSSEQISIFLKVKTSIFSGEIKDTSGQIVVSSIQTISRPASLAYFKSDDFDLIVVDEAHHSVAYSWAKVIEFFKADRLALTATPYRPDGRSVFDLFGQPVFKLRFSEAQKKGLIAQDRATIILTNSTIEGATSLNKEYTAAQLEKLWVSNDRNKTIIKSYLEFGRKEILEANMKPKAICFCINTEHAKRMSKLFNISGIKSEILSSKLDTQGAKERKQIYESFKKDNSIEILCVVNILNEGTDLPDVNVVLMLRPTRSNIVYSQQLGRAARFVDGKPFFVVLDFVDQTRREYSPYVAGNLTEKRYEAAKIITKYLTDVDPKVIDLKIKNIMKSVENFEDKIDLDILLTREQLIAEAKYFIEFGKYSKEFLDENKI